MKRILSLAVCILFGTSIFAQGLITVDGDKDSFWDTLTGPDDGYLQFMPFAHSDNGAPVSQEDLSAELWVAWDAEWFYLYAEITDDTISADGTQNSWESYLTDCLEFKIDGQATDSTETSLSFEGRLTALDSSETEEPTDQINNLPVEKKQYARRTMENGYALEFAVKWDTLGGSEPITVAEDSVFGMGIGIHDNDGNGRQASLQWSAVLLDAMWNTPKYLGTVKFLPDNKLQLIPSNNMTGVTNDVPYDGTEWYLSIDGEKDAFYETLTGPEEGYLQINSYAFSDNGAPHGDEDLSADVWVAWDAEWFYLYTEIMDDTISAEGTQNSWESYLTDNFEFKIDGHPTDSTETSLSYEGRLTALDSSETDAPTDQINNLPVDKKKYARRKMSNGYALEFAVKWDTLGGTEPITAEVDSVFGMGIGIHDNDGNSRQASIQWSAVLLDAMWNTPKYLGTVKLLEDHKLQFNPTNNMTGVSNEVPYDGTPFYMRIDAVKDPFFYTLDGPDDGHVHLRSYAWNDNGTPVDDADLSSKIWTAWDTEWFYLYTEVTDDTISDDGTSNVWEVDCIEIKVDGQATDSTQTSLSFDSRLTAMDSSETDGSTDQLNNIAVEDKQYARRMTDNGYILEFAVTWEALGGSEAIPVGVDSVFGLGFGVHDNDGNARQASIQWSAVLLDAMWNTPKYLGTARFREENRLQLEAVNNMTGVANEIPYDGSDYIRVGVEDKEPVPLTYALTQNYPNPFNPATTIGYTIEQRTNVRLVIYDLLGREVATLVNGVREPGRYEIQFDASGLSSGLYFYRLRAGTFEDTRKMMLLR